jgi:LPS O-antigen subunit length determinant protein (WzzB/FepE family)
MPYIQLENLIAVKKWIPEKNILIYDQNLFDEKELKWVNESQKSSTKKIPSYQEAFDVYMQILTTKSENGFITISLEHQSPFIAKQWLDIIIENINESMRAIDKKNAQRSIDFLNEQTELIALESSREIVAGLLENQIQTLMLLSSGEYYVFKIIDSPIAPEKKSGPARDIICIMGTFLGGIISILIALILNFRQSDKSLTNHGYYQKN